MMRIAPHSLLSQWNPKLRYALRTDQYGDWCFRYNASGLYNVTRLETRSNFFFCHLFFLPCKTKLSGQSLSATLSIYHSEPKSLYFLYTLYAVQGHSYSYLCLGLPNFKDITNAREPDARQSNAQPVLEGTAHHSQQLKAPVCLGVLLLCLQVILEVANFIWQAILYALFARPHQYFLS